MSKKLREKVAIVGAGPGGLAAAVLLQSKGFQVEIFERNDRVGGRSCLLEIDSFRFDMTPSSFLMPDVLKAIFSECGRNLEDYLQLERIDPSLRVRFADDTQILMSSDPQNMKSQLLSINSHDASVYEDFMREQAGRFNVLAPTLDRGVFRLRDIFNLKVIRALSKLSMTTVDQELKRFFYDSRIKQIFAAQCMPQGLASSQALAHVFVSPYVARHFGVWHPSGGIAAVSKAMEKLFLELGGKIYLNTRVSKIEVQRKTVRALRFENGWERNYAAIFLNADFPAAMLELLDEKDRNSWTDEKIAQCQLSCSAFVIHLGLSSLLPLKPQELFLSRDFQKNQEQIYTRPCLPGDPSFYVYNPSVLDPSLAPPGKSALSILVPVPNLRTEIDWELVKESFKNKILNSLQERSGVDLRPHIEVERVLTPLNWQQDFQLYEGAIYGLSQSLEQSMHFRPHNQFDDLENLFLIGSGTHPGAGFPWILKSAKIAVSLWEEYRANPLRKRELSFPWFKSHRATPKHKNVIEISSDGFAKK